MRTLRFQGVFKRIFKGHLKGDLDGELGEDSKVEFEGNFKAVKFFNLLK